MGEKRGFTGKLEYDFDVSALLEVLGKNDTWVRVTARDFRSWDGPRRLVTATIDPEDRHNNIFEEIDYWGPVYAYGTNTQVEYTDSRTIVDGNRASAKQRDRV